jgi:hypothetical protein
MIFADIRGKLGAEGQRAHSRSEDLLTSTAFGLLRYLPFEQGLGALLRRARVVERDGEHIKCSQQPDWLRLSGGLSQPIEFWPRLRQGGEPDLRLTFNGGAEVVLIEVKLDSGKSPIAGADEDDETAVADGAQELEERVDPDQLVRYWKGQTDELASDKRVSIIFLTAHAVPPSVDLLASLKRCEKMRLGWLSWRDVWVVADEAKSSSGADEPAADLAALLRHKGLFEFSGFVYRDMPSLPARGRFFDQPLLAAHDGSFFAAVRDIGNGAWAGVSGRFFVADGGRR